MDKAKESKQINKIIAIIDPNNIASRKILIKNGFTTHMICEMDGLPGEILSMKI
ncbi:GNAT family N-acetyltransferase [Thermoanaerobacterium xylanolyticum]|uniref:GNAT family N-acetyltransferase n=1 Tax=Thermoanaerobacterium xylanolyticum TaxID=29329 RepID=UPI0032C4596D